MEKSQTLNEIRDWDFFWKSKKVKKWTKKGTHNLYKKNVKKQKIKLKK